MELYVTKKVENGDDFSFLSSDTLPYMHVVTQQVIIKRDASGNYYITDVQGSEQTTSTNSCSYLMKIKKLICKQGFKKENAEGEPNKYKLADDIIWVKASPIMFYKRDDLLVPCNKLILNYPITLQLSCKVENVYSMGKPYNVYNMFWTIDYVNVDASFNIDMLG